MWWHSSPLSLFGTQRNPAVWPEYSYVYEYFSLARFRDGLILLELQSHLWGEPVKFQVVCPRNGTAVLSGLTRPHSVPCRAGCHSIKTRVQVQRVLHRCKRVYHRVYTLYILWGTRVPRMVCLFFSGRYLGTTHTINRYPGTPRVYTEVPGYATPGWLGLLE